LRKKKGREKGIKLKAKTRKLRNKKLKRKKIIVVKHKERRTQRATNIKNERTHIKRREKANKKNEKKKTHKL